jgi:DNA recombination protein RmuC
LPHDLIQDWVLPAAAIASILAFFLCAALLFMARRLLRLSQANEALQTLRLLAEQNLAAHRGEAETGRAMLAQTERVLIARGEETRRAVEERLSGLTLMLQREQGEGRVLFEQKLREMADASALRLGEIQRSVNETLHQAVEKQMQTSFARVIDQFTAVQKAMTDVQAMTTQIGDLKRIFSNVKSRGGWGETQLRTLLDDVLPNAYETNIRLSEASAEVVEFAVRMPGRDSERKLLSIDAKFPTADYERLLIAAETGDGDGEKSARRALETRLRQEAKKISDKYIKPPMTVEFAVMYLPTDGLYAEAARIPGLIDDLGRSCRVLVMGPSLLPALLRTIHLGYVTLALEQKAELIGRLLGATKQEMLKMDEVLERLGKNAGTMSKTIEDARQRTRAVHRKLQDVETAPLDDPEDVLHLKNEGGFGGDGTSPPTLDLA